MLVPGLPLQSDAAACLFSSHSLWRNLLECIFLACEKFSHLRVNNMASRWIQHVKAYQQNYACTYQAALKGASSTYRSHSHATSSQAKHIIVKDERGKTEAVYFTPEFHEWKSNNKISTGSRYVPANHSNEDKLLFIYRYFKADKSSKLTSMFDSNQPPRAWSVTIEDGLYDGYKITVEPKTGGKRKAADRRLEKEDQAVAAQETKTVSACNNYTKLYDIYDTGYEPPAWVDVECAHLLEKYGSTARVIFAEENFSKEIKSQIKRLAEEREPVNIAMEPFYKLKQLQETFGYSQGAYGEISKDGKQLPPQIGVSCLTPVKYNGVVKDIAVVNIIGLAFDDKKQPDFKYFYRKGSLDREGLLTAMTQAYVFAFQATKYMGRKTLCASPIGDQAFRPKREYPVKFNAEGIDAGQEKFIEDFVMKAIVAAKKSDLAFKDIELEFARFNQQDPGDPDSFTVPACFFKGKWTKDLDSRVFINAWDCWSMLGNGNNRDSSADGFWGRSSAISLLGWPKSNPHIKTLLAPKV